MSLYFAYILESFDKGLELCRLIMQEGIKPSTVRLSDSEETEFILSLRQKPSGVLKSRAQDWALKKSLKFLHILPYGDMTREKAEL